MGVSKKAPLLGSSASIGESGPSVIEGDRNLLSHYGGNSERLNGGLSVATRKSAALRRNLVARGLAKQYSDQKAREENHKAPVPRYQRQQKILENYQHQQAHHNAAEKEAETAERHEDSDDNNDFSENVVLVLPKRTNSAPSKPSGRPKRLVSPVVPPKGTTSFRNTCMRQFRENQDERSSRVESDETPRSNKDLMPARLKVSPSEADIPRAQLRPLPRPSSSRTQKELSSQGGFQRLSSGPPSGPAPWLSSTHRSSRIVLSELAITKDIMMREQLVRQLKQALLLIDTLAQEILKGQEGQMQAQASLEAAKAMSPSRMEKTGSLIGLALASTVDSDPAHNAETDAEVAVAESSARLADVTKRTRHHIHHVGLLVNGLQQTTVSIVEGILDWRQMRQRRQQMSNFQRLFRFPWRRKKITNYLLHLSDDLRSLFPSVALELLLGPKATYNPLLLSRAIVPILGTSSIGKTFLTERNCSNMTTKGPLNSASPERMKQCCINSVGLKRLQEALANSAKSTEGSSSPVKPSTQAVDHDRLRRCLESIYQESELEALEKQRVGEEEQRVKSAYDPFSTIKSAGGVEETISNMLVLQSPTSHLLGEQLRIRQEDTTRAAVPANGPQSTQKDPSAEVLHINPERLRDFLEKRAALLQPVADCELRDIQKWGMKNKLQGKIMVRKNNEKRVEHVLARKIQLQYLAHRQRNALQSNLTNFVRNVQVSVINIQRIFRGHRAKCDYACMRRAWLEHKRRLYASRTIINAFRRYRRRQHHRRSMTVESIAQAQLISLLAAKLNEGNEQDATERYRRVGEERRRQRIVLLQKHKMEQQEIERKRVAAAVRMQAVVRAHLAQGQAKILRQEKKAHMNAVSAMAIQSTIRKFLNVQQERRHRFRKDLERVNQSAVRIQSIYRGYNSRTSLLGQLDEQTRRTLDTEFAVNTLDEGDTDDENDEDDDESSASDEEDESSDQSDSAPIVEKAVVVQENLLPPIVASISRPSSSRSSAVGLDERATLRSRTPTNSVSLPPLWARDGSSSSLVSSTSSSGTGRRISIKMMRVELKLKDAELGDKFEAPPSRRNSFIGSKCHQT